MMMRILGPSLGIALGGLLGHSQVLCFNGQCMITGTWLGGALMGGLVGLLLTSSPSADEPEPVPVPIPKDD